MPIAAYTQMHMDNLERNGRTTEGFYGDMGSEARARSRIRNAAKRLGVKVSTRVRWIKKEGGYAVVGEVLTDEQSTKGVKPMRTRTYMDVRFDVTDLSEDERDALAMEVAVQAEESDFIGDDGNGWVGHQDVETKIEWNEIEVEEPPMYSWFGWTDGADACDPPEPGKQWLTITESDSDGVENELAVIVHRHTGRDDGVQMAKKVASADRIVEALNTAVGAYINPHWAVGKIGGNMIRVGNQSEAEAAIAGIELVDPRGVANGMYFIDPPADDENPGDPGESAISSNALRSVPTPLGQEGAAGPRESEEASKTSYVLTVCADGEPITRDFHAIEETIEATGEAICAHEENPNVIVSILLSEKIQDYRAGLKVMTAERAMRTLFGYQFASEDFDAHTAQFISGADVCEALASFFGLSSDQINIMARAYRERQ